MGQKKTSLIVSDYQNGIFAIDADYIRPYMATVHLVKEGEGLDAEAILIDTGTSYSMPLVLQALKRERLPNAKLFVHPRGSRHMIDPSKLIAGTIDVYGEDRYKKLYKEILPIDANRVVEVSDGDVLTVGKREFELIHTEGHAKHHYCLVDKTNGDAFTGDSFGVSYRETDNQNGHFIFPTTTPVHFDPDAAHASIEKIMSYGLQYVYLTHYSQRGGLQNCADQLHDDLEKYLKLTKDAYSKTNAQEHLEKSLYQYLIERLAKHKYHGDDASIYTVIGPDTKLNAAGLMHWAKINLN